MDKHAIRISNVVKQHALAKSRTLDGLSVEIPDRRVTLLIGENGSGKSTLLNCIVGILPFEEGTIEVEVNSRVSYRLTGGKAPSIPSDTRSAVGVIFQHKALWPHFTVRENISHPLQTIHTRLSKSDIAARVERYLKKLELDPDVLGKYPQQLSGGQQRKVAIARTLAAEPELLVIDELEANLDQPSLEIVLNVLAEEFVEKEKTVLMISHRPDVIQRFEPYVIGLPRNGEKVVVGRSIDTMIRTLNAEPVSAPIAKVIQPSKQWVFARLCSAVAYQISSLTLREKDQGRLLIDVGKQISGLLCQLDPDMSHLLLIATRSGNEYMVRSAEVSPGFRLNGKDADKLNAIVEPSTVDGGKVLEYAPRHDYRELILQSKGFSLPSGKRHNGLIDYLFEEGPQALTYQQAKHSEEIEGAYWIGIPIPENLKLERLSYNEFSKETNHVYMIAIRFDNEVKGVVSIDTTARKKWPNFVIEQLVLIANMTAIAMKQLENGAPFSVLPPFSSSGLPPFGNAAGV
jgi:ABC-type lipoprotein export system ATPase subunit